VVPCGLCLGRTGERGSGSLWQAAKRHGRGPERNAEDTASQKVLRVGGGGEKENGLKALFRKRGWERVKEGERDDVKKNDKGLDGDKWGAGGRKKKGGVGDLNVIRRVSRWRDCEKEKFGEGGRYLRIAKQYRIAGKTAWGGKKKRKGRLYLQGRGAGLAHRKGNISKEGGKTCFHRAGKEQIVCRRREREGGGGRGKIT